MQNNPDTLQDSDNNFNNPSVAQAELLEDATLLTNIGDKIETIIDILTQSIDIAQDAACQLGGGDCDFQDRQDDREQQNRSDNPSLGRANENSRNSPTNGSNAFPRINLSHQELVNRQSNGVSANDVGDLAVLEGDRVDLVCLDAKLSVILDWFNNPDAPIQVPVCSAR